MKLTVVVICCGRQELLERCVLSILEVLPKDAELKVIVNGHHPESVRWLSAQGAPLTWIQIPKTSRCIARNNALADSTSEIVYFLDDDVVVPPHLFELALKSFEDDKDLAILGGPNLTPPNSTFAEKCFGAVVTSSFCAPKVNRRYVREGKGNPQSADQHDLILCNFAVRRQMVWPKLRFVPNLTSNEENVFVFDGQKLGLKICRSSELYVYHVRRSTLGSFLRQVRSYGSGRGEQMVLRPQSNHGMFYLALLLPPTAMFALLLFPTQFPSWTGAYLILSLMGATLSSEARALGLRGILAVTFLTPLVHLTFCGSMWRVLFKWAGAYWGSASLESSALRS